jgi:hypothetical protein
MNYIELVNAFWEDGPYKEGYKASYGILYLSILDFINKNRWRETEVDYDRMMSKTQIRKDYFLSGRVWLQENGYISFTNGLVGKYLKAKYSIPMEEKNNGKKLKRGSTGVDTGTKIDTKNDTKIDTEIDTKNDTKIDTEIDTHLKDKHLNNKTFKHLNTETMSDSVFLKNEKNVFFENGESSQTVIPENEKEKSCGKKEKEQLFNDLFEQYGRKGSEAKSVVAFEGITSAEIETIVIHLPKYVQSTPNERYRKSFENYLTEKVFNNKIINNDHDSRASINESNGQSNGANSFSKNLRPTGIQPPASRKSASFDELLGG